jgi:long-chain acyl-CoA synthetase
MQRDICIDRLSRRAHHHNEDAAYFSKDQNAWSGISWGAYHERVRQFAKSLLWANVAADGKVAILGFNRLEWLIGTMAAQYIGAVSVGVYTSSSMEEVFYVVDHSDAEILVVENLARYNKQVKPKVAELTKIKHIVLMSEEDCSEDKVLKFSEFLARGKSIEDPLLEKRFQSVKPNAVATMIYTSGTTGNPKSVMLSHESVAWTVRTVVQAWRCAPTDKGISYLPLAHVAEQMLTIYAPIDCGMTCYFVESPEKFKNNLKEIEPTVFFGVPRVFEKIYEGIKLALSEKDALTQKIINHFSKISFNYYQARHAGKMPSLWNNIQYMIAHKKIFPTIKERIGFGKTRLCMVGAAPISKDIMNFFLGIDMPIYEVYGQSENSGPTTLSLPGQTKIGSVGKAMPGAEIVIAADGEILIKGPHIFLGYYKNAEATRETLKDGWLASGDIGTLDNDGFLIITDRKKDILITAGGKNISPQNLESMLKQLPYVQSAVVVGDNKKYLAALFAPDIESIDKKAKEMGLPSERILSANSLESIHQEISAELLKINQKLAPVEQIKKYKLLSQEFTIDSGELTPTLKVKRKFINQKYQREIAEMYQ